MKDTDLQNAIVEIKTAFDAEGSFPFFFIVGAGVSCPLVKLANEITDECEKKARDYYKENQVAISEPNPIFQ